MKTCPKCWKNYPDRYKQCVRCKKTLVNSNKTRSNLSQKKENFDLNKIKQIKTEKREDKFLEELEGKLIVHSNIFHPEKLKKVQEFDFNGEKFCVYEK